MFQKLTFLAFEDSALVYQTPFKRQKPYQNHIVISFRNQDRGQKQLWGSKFPLKIFAAIFQQVAHSFFMVICKKITVLTKLSTLFNNLGDHDTFYPQWLLLSVEHSFFYKQIDILPTEFARCSQLVALYL